MPDHVHLLVSFPPKYSISDVVKKLKGASARHWFIQYPESKKLLWKGHLWHSSYFVSTTGNVSTNIVSDYIKNQKKSTTSILIHPVIEVTGFLRGGCYNFAQIANSNSNLYPSRKKMTHYVLNQGT